MNIFSALAEGKGRLHEPSLSAFLAFLLTPTRSHGLSDSFLRAFLSAVAKSCGNDRRFDDVLSAVRLDADIGLEVRHGNRTVDVEVTLLEPGCGSDARELHRIIIENKIRSAAAQDHQLLEEFTGVLTELTTSEDTKVTAVFLTPGSQHEALQREYDSLTIPRHGGHAKAWMHWKSIDNATNSQSILTLIREVLQKEACAEIEPVSEYTRHTLKAFVRFIDNLPSVSGSTRQTTNSEEDEVIDERVYDVGGRRFNFVRYESGVVKAFDENGQETSAKPLLRSLNDERRLGINLLNRNGNNKNTRQLGKEILERLASTP